MNKAIFISRNGDITIGKDDGDFEQTVDGIVYNHHHTFQNVEHKRKDISVFTESVEGMDCYAARSVCL